MTAGSSSSVVAALSAGSTAPDAPWARYAQVVSLPSGTSGRVLALRYRWGDRHSHWESTKRLQISLHLPYLQT